MAAAQHSTAQRAPHSQVLGSIPRPLHVLHGSSPGAAAAQSCVHWADWPLHTVQQVSVWRVVGPSELELRLQTQTASMQHGQCRNLTLVDLISTPNIIRQHLSLIQMNHFPDTKYVFFFSHRSPLPAVTFAVFQPKRCIFEF